MKKLLLTLGILLLAVNAWALPPSGGNCTKNCPDTTWGSGTPDVAQNGGSGYFSSTIEVDGNARFDGTQVLGIGHGATYTVCASDAINLKGCDYIADGTNDEVEIQAALDKWTYTTGTVLSGLHIRLSDGKFVICDPLIMEGQEWLQGAGGTSTAIQLCDTFTISQENGTPAGSVQFDGTDIELVVPDGTAFAVGDHIWISDFETDDDTSLDVDIWLENNEFCIAAIENTHELVLGAVQSGWADCSGNKLNETTYCGINGGTGDCVLGTVTDAPKVGIIYDASAAAGKKQRAAIVYLEGSALNRHMTITDLSLRGNNATNYGARGIDTGDGSLTNKVAHAIFRNLQIDSFVGDGIRLDHQLDSVLESLTIGHDGSNDGYGIHIIGGGDWLINDIKATSNMKAGIRIGTNSAGGTIERAYLSTKKRLDAYAGFALHLESGNIRINNNYLGCASNDCATGDYKHAYGIYVDSTAGNSIFSNNIIGGSLGGIYSDDATGLVITENRNIDNAGGVTPKLLVYASTLVSFGHIVENNRNADYTCTSNCILVPDQLVRLDSSGGNMTATVKFGNYPGHRVTFVADDVTNQTRGGFSNNALGALTCYFREVQDILIGIWDGVNWHIDFGNTTADCGKRVTGTSVDLIEEAPYTNLDPNEGIAVSGTLADITDGRYHGHIHTFKYVEDHAVCNGDGCMITITSCDQDGNADGDCVIALDDVADECTFAWNGVTVEWEMISNSGCTIAVGGD